MKSHRLLGIKPRTPASVLPLRDDLRRLDNHQPSRHSLRTAYFSHTPDSHSVCAISTPLGIKVSQVKLLAFHSFYFCLFKNVFFQLSVFKSKSVNHASTTATTRLSIIYKLGYFRKDCMDLYTHKLITTIRFILRSSCTQIFQSVVITLHSNINVLTWRNSLSVVHHVHSTFNCW